MFQEILPGRVPPSDTAPPLPFTVKLLGWASLLNDVASEMIYPVLPQFILQVLGGTRFHLGLIEGVAETTSSVLKLMAGAWSDRQRSRRPLILAGYTLAAVARPILAYALVPWQAFALRTLDRVGKGLRTAPRDAMITDATAPAQRGRAFGFHRAMDHVGAAIGPLLATLYLLAWPDQLRSLFCWTALPGLAVVVVLVWGLREIPSARDWRATSGSPVPGESSSSPLPLNFRRVVRRLLALQPPGTGGPLSQVSAETVTNSPASDPFRRYLLAVGCFTLSNSSDAFLLVRAMELGVPAAALPLLWCLLSFVKAAGNAVSGRLVDRYGAKRLLLSGWSLYAALYVCFAWVEHVVLFWLMVVLYGLFYACTEPAEKTMVAQLVPANRRGLAFGWFNLANGILALPASALFGWLYEYFGPTAAFATGSSFACLAVAMLASMRIGAQGSSASQFDFSLESSSHGEDTEHASEQN